MTAADARYARTGNLSPGASVGIVLEFSWNENGGDVGVSPGAHVWTPSAPGIIVAGVLITEEVQDDGNAGYLSLVQAGAGDVLAYWDPYQQAGYGVPVYEFGVARFAAGVPVTAWLNGNGWLGSANVPVTQGRWRLALTAVLL